MKYIRKFAGITICLTIVFMLVASFGHQRDEEVSYIPNQLEYLLDEDWHLASVDGDKTSTVSLPYTEKNKERDTILFTNSLPTDYAGFSMKFSSENADVRVLLDGEVIYEETGSPEKRSEHLVHIPNTFQNGEVRMELTVLDKKAATTLGDILFESRGILVIGLMGNNFVDIVCFLLIEIVAIIMCVLVLMRWYTSQPSRGEIFLGLFEFAAGVYCFVGTSTMRLFFNMQGAHVMQGYLMLLIPLFFVLYFERNLRTLYPRRFALLLCCVILNAGIQILLQISGVKSLEGMEKFSIVVLSSMSLVAIVSLVQMFGRDRQYLSFLSLVSLVVLISGEIATLVLDFFFLSGYGYLARQYSITAFSVIMAVMHVFQISKEYRLDAEKKMVEAKEQNLLLAQAKRDADAARQEALAANEAKGKFLAHMSHEIRTPINAVLGMDEMILRESKEQNIKEYAMDIHTAGQSLLSLINDILDFSKIESGKMEIVPVEYDVSSMFHDLVNMISQRAMDKNLSLVVEIEHEIPSRLYGDDVRIRQVLTNILTNAVKYTHEGTVWLRIRGDRTGDTAVLNFEVEDTGIGIKEEDLPKLSAEFERIEEDRNRNIEGSGLGMNITILLLNMLGSRLHVESVYGKGSKFSFELEQKIVDCTPIGDFESKVHQIAQNYSYSTNFHAKDAKILVVDDNAVNRKVLRNLLKETQIQVSEAGGGRECVDLVKENRYDLIFLDHMMPEMDGVETLHHIKALPECPCEKTPIIMLTANAVSGAKEKYLNEGFDDFLSKPIVPEKLENMIKKFLPEELLTYGDFEPENTKEGEGQTEGTQASLEDLPFVDGLDWNYAWMHLPEMDLLQYTVKEFYSQIDSGADSLMEKYEHIHDPDCLEEYRIQVHAMKSLAATVGIIPLSGVARVLEYAAKDGKIDVIMSMTPVFLQEWRSYRQKLQGVFGLGTGEEKEITDYSVMQALVEMVRVSMREMDIDQADGLMEQLRTYKFPEDIRENIQKLGEAVTNLDIEESDRLGILLTAQMADRP